jgi:glycosyltransferase involved in cell wall biosynthesis
MKKKVSIVTSGHPYYDERIFYKFARSLNKNGYEVSIICSTVESEIDFVKDNIHIIGFNGSILKKSEKVSKFYDHLTKPKPDVIICCEPLPILAANKIRRERKNVRIIYDVTEWYPENVAFKFSGIKKFLIYLPLFIFNIITSNIVDALIIGEKFKKKRYNIVAPFKKKQIINYYPVLEFFNHSVPKFDGKEITLCYAGLLKFDRGINKLLEVARKFSDLNKDLLLGLKLIGKFESTDEENELKKTIEDEKKIKIQFTGWTEYPRITALLSDVHICFDLREHNFIYSNSLPIKIFEYMACGKPFIFSDIKPIRDELNFTDYGFLVDPNDIDETVKSIQSYVDNPNLLLKHSNNARKIIETEKNWERESIKLIAFMNLL